MTIKPIVATTQKRVNSAADASSVADKKEDVASGDNNSVADVQLLAGLTPSRSANRCERRNEVGLYDEHGRSQRNNIRGNYDTATSHSPRSTRQQTRERTEQSRAASVQGSSSNPTYSHNLYTLNNNVDVKVRQFSEKCGVILAKSVPDNTLAAATKNEEETHAGYNSGDEHEPQKTGVVSAEEWKIRDEKFVKILSERRGFIVQQVEEDGACLFRAISLQIYGDEDMHDVIRQNTMDYIYKNREYFCHFVTEDINSYIKRKRRKDSHGNHIEIQVMSEIYSRPVEVYCYDSKPINIFNSEQMTNCYTPLRLSYQRGSHYNAILDPYNATVGVGLGLAGYEPKLQTKETILLSEQLEIERTMFEDKIKTTDGEATNEAIEEQIARESYLQWCRENLQRSSQNAKITSTVTSEQAECTSTSPVNMGKEQRSEEGTKDVNKKAALQRKDDDEIQENRSNKVDEEPETNNVIHSSKKRRRDQLSKSPSHVESLISTKELSRQNSASRKPTKCANFSVKTSALEDVAEQPSTSKRSNETEINSTNKNKAVSNLYAELLEAVTQDSCHSNETQMLQRAMQLSREDYLKDQKRMYLRKLNNNNNTNGNSNSSSDVMTEWHSEN